MEEVGYKGGEVTHSDISTLQEGRRKNTWLGGELGEARASVGGGGGWWYIYIYISTEQNWILIKGSYPRPSRHLRGFMAMSLKTVA